MSLGLIQNKKLFLRDTQGYRANIIIWLISLKDIFVKYRIELGVDGL